MMQDVGNSQRAIWMGLITSLAAPFFASLIVVALTFTGPLADYLLPAQGGSPLGEIAVNVFAWSALPATAAALGLIPFVLQLGSYSWLQAAVAGVLGFAAGAIIFPLPDGGAPPVLAFLAGLIAIGMRMMLIRGGILLEPQGR